MENLEDHLELSLTEKYPQLLERKKNAPCSAPCSAIVLQTKLYNRHCIKIPHNRIHTVLNDHSLASNLPKNKGEGNGSYRKEGKKERKKMEHELWHTD